MMQPTFKVIFCLSLCISLSLSISKTLSQNCFCDVSTSCDQQCCCDNNCLSSAITYWNNYNLCANDGFAIPFCTSQINQPLHVHDLSEGLRLIYTVIKRMFCISRTNFVVPSTEYKTTSIDAEVPASPVSVPAVNQNILSLATVGTYTALPIRNSAGQCVATAIRDMNNIVSQKCRVSTTLTTISTNGILDPQTFATNNALDPTLLNVYRMENTALTSVVKANTITLTACTATGTTNVCECIKDIKLFFVKGTTTTIDYTASYLVLGKVYVNNPTFIELEYSYQFIPSVGTYPFSSNQGYTIGSPLNLIYFDSVASSYTKMFNPVNLAFRKEDGTCRTATTDNADGSNLANIRFGVNSIYSCVGTSSTFLSTILANLFNFVGSFGLSSTNINDYVSVTTSAIGANENIHLLFYYMPVGTQLDPQYQILQVQVQPSSTLSTQVNLFIQFQPYSTSVFINVPAPPTIHATLPNDFLYPFFVA